MKRSIFCLIAMLCLLCGHSQEKSRAIRKGQSSVNVYYGYRLWPAFVQILSRNDQDNLKLRTIGPFGFVYEYMISNIIGLGLEAGHGRLIISLDNQQTDSSGVRTVFRESVTVANTRLMSRANFHFLRSAHMDMYGLVSFGYRRTTYTATKTAPNSEIPEPTKGWSPVGIKPGIGFRYFFNRAGLHLELAAGTPAIAGGVSLRF